MRYNLMGLVRNIKPPKNEQMCGKFKAATTPRPSGRKAEPTPVIAVQLFLLLVVAVSAAVFRIAVFAFITATLIKWLPRHGRRLYRHDRVGHELLVVVRRLNARLTTHDQRRGYDAAHHKL